MKSPICISALLLAAAIQLNAQGYVVPNGVSYVGLNFGGGYEIDVVHDPTNYYSTGFSFYPQGKTPPAVYVNTFQFAAIVDVSVRVFLVASNQPISLQPILAGSYTELMFPGNYVFDNNSPFYVGLYTGNQNYYPPDGIYTDPLFGWARLVNNRGVIEMLDSALVYKAEGIYTGTLNFVPEPSSLSLGILGATLFRMCRRRGRSDKPVPRR